MTKQYTIDDIRCQMVANGSHWWDADTMRFFKLRVHPRVYQGSGGIYFVTSEKGPSGVRACSVRRFNPEQDLRDVETVGAFNCYSRAIAHRLAAEAAKRPA